MQITFLGPDGQFVTVSDLRREAIPPKSGKDTTVALPRERQLTSWMLTNFRA